MYTDLKARGTKPAGSVLAREIRVRMHDGEHVPGPLDEPVIEVVVDETLQQGDDA